MTKPTITTLEGKEARALEKEINQHIRERKRAAKRAGAKTMEGFAIVNGKAVVIT